MNKVKSFFSLGNFVLSLKESVTEIENRLDSHDQTILKSKENDNTLAKEVIETKRALDKLEDRISRMETLLLNINMIRHDEIMNIEKEKTKTDPAHKLITS